MVIISHSLLSLLEKLRHSRPARHLGHPRIVRVKPREIRYLLRHGQKRHRPRNKHQISIRHLIADKKLRLLLLQVAVNDTHDAANFIDVAVNCGLHRLRVVSREPAELTIVRSLAGHLEVFPDAGLVFLRGVGVGELVGGIVCVDDVVDYSAGLEGY